MYKVSPTIIELLNKNYRQIVKISVSGKNGNFVITESEILQGSLQIDRYCVSGSKIEVGSAIAAELSFDLKNDNGKYDNTVFEGAELYVQIGIKDWTVTGTTPTYWIPCGHFIIDTPPRHKTIIKVSALDRMMLFDRLVDRLRLSFPMTVEDLLSRICSICGVTMVSNLTKLVNRTYTIKECPEDASITYRTLLQWCTALMGACAFMNSDGNLEIKWYEPTGITITPSERYDSDMYENDISISGVYFKDNEEGKEYIAGSDSYCLDLSGNELIQGYQQLVVDTLYVALKDFAYRPYEASVKPMPYLYPMDKISYVDSKGVTHSTIVTNVNFVMNQNTKIAGKGETAQNESYDKNNGLTKQQAAILEVIRKKVESGITSREQAALEMNRLLANSMGLYRTEVKQDDGSTKYYFHDGQTPETSNIIYTFQANGFAWTKHWNNGNPIWEYGMTKDGNALMNVLAAYKITADYIEVGSITADKIATSYKESVTTQIEKTVDGKLVNYVTTTDMQSAIKQASDSITTSVSKTYVTTTTFDKDMNTVKGQASNALTQASNANNRINGIEQNYATKVEMKSQIQQTAESINQTVSKKVGKDEVISAINQTAESVKIKANHIELTGNVTISALSQDALNTIKGYSSQALADAKNYTEQQLNSVKSDAGNLLKGSNLTQTDVTKYWDTSGDLYYNQSDPLGGKNAVKLDAPLFTSGSSPGDYFLSAKYNGNNPITAPAVYEARVWLKSDFNTTIKISLNRTTFDCNVTTQWKQYRFMLDVKAPDTHGWQNFTIGGWSSITDGDTIYIYKPEVIISYSPTDILNLLTNNGAMDGLFIRNNKIYMKGSYIDVNDLKALNATIGGFSIGTSGIYKGCTSITSTGQGVYVGTNGIRLYVNNDINLTFDMAKRKMTLSGVQIEFKKNANAERAVMDGRDGTVTCRYGLHVYTKREDELFTDGTRMDESEFVVKGLPHITSGTMLVRESQSARICTASSSSKRYKNHVANMTVNEAEKILDIPVVWFKYKEGYLVKEDRFVGKAVPGFYAEDVYENFPEAANLNEDGSVEDWNYRMLIPAMMKLIQELYKRTGGIKSE